MKFYSSGGLLCGSGIGYFWDMRSRRRRRWSGKLSPTTTKTNPLKIRKEPHIMWLDQWPYNFKCTYSVTLWTLPFLQRLFAFACASKTEGTPHMLAISSKWDMPQTSWAFQNRSTTTVFAVWLREQTHTLIIWTNPTTHTPSKGR